MNTSKPKKKKKKAAEECVMLRAIMKRLIIL
jgi:hypothetical protein